MSKEIKMSRCIAAHFEAFITGFPSAVSVPFGLQ
jgi:hypothetical protein